MYVLVYKGKGIKLAKPNWDGNWEKRYFPEISRTEDKFEFVSSINVEGTTPQGIMYTTDLAGSDGVHVTLVSDSETLKEQVDLSKRWLRNCRDVTGFTVVKVDEWIEWVAKETDESRVKKATELLHQAIKLLEPLGDDTGSIRSEIDSAIQSIADDLLFSPDGKSI